MLLCAYSYLQSARENTQDHLAHQRCPQLIPPAALPAFSAPPPDLRSAASPSGRPAVPRSTTRSRKEPESQRCRPAHELYARRSRFVFRMHYQLFFWCIFVNYSKDHVVKNELIYHVRLCSVQCKDQMLGRFLLVSENNFGIRIKCSGAIFLLRSLDQKIKFSRSILMYDVSRKVACLCWIHECRTVCSNA
jgi:hypothetical protein